jgi:anti-sigma factor RsiW
VSQHLSEPAIKRYREGQSSPAETLSLDDHLANCQACAARILSNDSAAAAAQVLTALQLDRPDDEDVHLAHQSMADYVDEVLDDVDREVLESHLELCPTCRIEVRDLRAIKAQLAEEPLTTDSPPQVVSFPNRLTAFWRVPSMRVTAQVAAALIIVLLIVVVAWLNSRRSPQLAIKNDNVEKQPLTVNPAGSPAPPEAGQPPEASKAQLVVELIDGERHVTLNSADKLGGFESAPVQMQQQVALALKQGRVKTPSFIADLKGKPGALMGTEPEQRYGLLSPVATAVESQKPMFSWRALAGTENYVVSVYDADAKKVAGSEPLTQTKWQCSTPLVRGRTYSWQVRANVNGKEQIMPSPAAAEARFRVIDETRSGELTAARQKYPESHLLLGVLYADTGLLEQAEHELRMVVQANPKSAVARSLLESVVKQRRAK